jgi:hypothetical protein
LLLGNALMPEVESLDYTKTQDHSLQTGGDTMRRRSVGSALLGILFAATISTGAMAASLHWNLAADFRTSPNQANPGPDSMGNEGVWHFLTSESLDRDPGQYRALDEFIPNAFDIPGLEQWQDSRNLLPNNRVPEIGINASGRSQFFISLDWPNEVVRVHPYVNQLAVVGWRSPIDGIVDVRGSFGDMDANGGNGVLWFIDQARRTVAEGNLDGTTQTFAIDGMRFAKGDFLYFAVDPKGNDFSFDSTSVNVDIAAIPLPAGFWLIASCLAMALGLGALPRVRRLGF